MPVTSSLAVAMVDDPVGFRVIAHPIYTRGDLYTYKGALLEFDVVEDDAEGLKRLVGQTKCFNISDFGIFWATLESLRPCTKEEQNDLPLLAQKTVLRGTFYMIGDDADA